MSLKTYEVCYITKKDQKKFFYTRSTSESGALYNLELRTGYPLRDTIVIYCDEIMRD